MYERVIRNPILGPHGETVCVVVTPPHGPDETTWYWTAQEALDARDMLLDATPGCQVRVRGLPTVIAGGGLDDVIDGRD